MYSPLIDFIDLQNPDYKKGLNSLYTGFRDSNAAFFENINFFLDSLNLIGTNPLVSLSSTIINLQKEQTEGVFRYLDEITKEIKPMPFTLENRVIFEDSRMKVLKIDTDSYPEYPNAGTNGNVAISVPFMRGPSLTDYNSNEETSITRQAMKRGFSPYIILFKEGDDKNKFDTHSDYRDSARKTLYSINEESSQTPHLVNICAAGYKFTIAVAEDIEEKVNSLKYSGIRKPLIKSLTNVGVPWEVSPGSPIRDAADRIPEEMIDSVLRENNYLTDGKGMSLFWKLFTFEHALDYFFNSDLKLLRETLNPSYDSTKRDVFRSWMEQDYHPLPGTLHKELVKEVFKEARLPEKFGNVLGNIEVPSIFLTGEKDDISLPEDCRSMAKYLGTPPESTFFLEKSKKGHSGIYISKDSVSKSYPSEKGWELREEGYYKQDDGSWQDIFDILEGL
ncbi:MAG: hypothetical protein ACOC1P_05595 [Minisyncoccales bacterium]